MDGAELIMYTTRVGTECAYSHPSRIDQGVRDTCRSSNVDEAYLADLLLAVRILADRAVVAAVVVTKVAGLGSAPVVAVLVVA